ncbi:MAG: hypothetical protein WD875_01515 [Pirellulales bacterium]
MADDREPIQRHTVPMPPRRVAKTRGTFLLPDELLDELRDASYWARQSLAAIAQRALQAELLRMRDQFNAGSKFTRRPAA